MLSKMKKTTTIKKQKKFAREENKTQFSHILDMNGKIDNHGEMSNMLSTIKETKVTKKVIETGL